MNVGKGNKDSVHLRLTDRGRAVCGESRTHGSEGGVRKRTGLEPAPRLAPTLQASRPDLWGGRRVTGAFTRKSTRYRRGSGPALCR